MYAVFKVHIDWCFISHQKSQILFQLYLKSLITGKFSFFFFWSGAHLLSHTVSSAVPSADWVLTVVFGMGTGVSPNRIGTRRIKFYLLDNSTVKHIAIFYFFFRFSWIDSAVFTAYCIQFLRKEVIQPHLPIRLPCYDFTPVIGPAFGSSFFAVRSLTSGVTDSHGVTGGVYKTRERIHRGILIRDY